MVPFLKYTALRLALFVATGAVLYLLGARGLLLLLLAAVVSMPLSFLLLRGPRDELSTVIVDRTRPERRGQSRFSRSIAEDAAAEDAAVDGAAGDDSVAGDGGAAGDDSAAGRRSHGQSDSQE